MTKYMMKKAVIAAQNRLLLGTSFTCFLNVPHNSSIYASNKRIIPNIGTGLYLIDPVISPVRRCWTLLVFPQPGQYTWRQVQLGHAGNFVPKKIKESLKKYMRKTAITGKRITIILKNVELSLFSLFNKFASNITKSR